MDSMDLDTQFPNMAQLIGAYLNQDYTIHGPDLEDAVTAFIGDATPEMVAETRVEIARFLETKANDLDAELDRLSYGDHSCDPDMNAHDYLVWLDGVLAAGLAKKQS